MITWRADVSLQWADFQAVADPASRYAALASTGINFSYTARRNGSLSLTFSVHAYFDKSQSWRKTDRQNDALLTHEQLHFNIAELHARILKRAFDSYKFSNNFKQEIKLLFTGTMNSLRDMQDKYDRESDHSKNKEKQLEWEQYVAAELAKLEPDAVSMQ